VKVEVRAVRLKTTREKRGLTQRQLAHDLGISQRTVENHRSAVMKRTGVASLPDLIRLVMAAAARVFARRCVVGIRANVERCRQYAELTGQLVTAIAPVVGYDRAAELFKKAVARDVPIRQVLEDEKVIPKEEIARLLDLHQLARGGRAGGSR